MELGAEAHIEEKLDLFEIHRARVSRVVTSAISCLDQASPGQGEIFLVLQLIYGVRELAYGHPYPPP